MNVYATLLVFVSECKDFEILLNQDNQIPMERMDGSTKSIECTKKLFHSITGIDPSWHIYFKPCYILEENDNIYIIYSVYLPQRHSIKNTYKWDKIRNIRDSSLESKLFIHTISQRW